MEQMELLKMMSFIGLKFKWNQHRNKVIYKIINEGKNGRNRHRAPSIRQPLAIQ